MPSPPPTKTDPEKLDGDYRPRDIAEALARLSFDRAGQDRKTFCLIAIDAHVRDYLVAAVSARLSK